MYKKIISFVSEENKLQNTRIERQSSRKHEKKRNLERHLWREKLGKVPRKYIILDKNISKTRFLECKFDINSIL